jgi:sterol desaturase/sphingolipid hydroxylase (fatty acid hydroxylase superfamily)
MKWFHLIFGVVLFFVFTTTGDYMRVDFPDKEAISQELRVLMRSRHIYILFSALIHLVLGAYLSISPTRWRSAVQYLGSLMLTAASVLLVWAFITETYTVQGFSDYSRYGIYASLAGVVMHLVGGVSRR